MAMAAVTVALLAIIVAAAYLRRRSTSSSSSAAAAGGGFLDLVRNSGRILDWTTDLLASSPTATAPSFMGLLTANPANVEHILKDRFDNYPKGDRSTDILADFLGSGIFNSDGDTWRIQRKTASLEFSTKTIRTFVMSNVRSEAAARLLPILRSEAGNAAVIDLQDLLERFAFDNVCQVAFGHDPATLQHAAGAGDQESAEFARAFESATELCVARFRHPHPITWKLLRWLGLGSEARLRREIATVHAFATRIVRLRKKQRRQHGDGDDLLSRFLAEKEDYPEEFLRDIIVSFVLAGRDTTSATLTWFFWLISTAAGSDVMERLTAEIRAARARCGRSPEQEPVLPLDELRGMDYLHAALSETLRLYPPVPLQSRACAADDVLPDGTAVEKGQVVMYSSYAMGRSERIWGEDCREYRPERWLDEAGRFRMVSPFRFPVFHAGPRMCLGKDMAYIQMKAVAAAVIENFEVDVVDKRKVLVHDFLMILRVKGGLPVRLRCRCPTPPPSAKNLS